MYAAQRMRSFAVADGWSDASAFHDRSTLPRKQHDTRFLLTAQIA